MYFKLVSFSSLNDMTASAVVADPEKKSITMSFSLQTKFVRCLIRLTGFGYEKTFFPSIKSCNCDEAFSLVPTPHDDLSTIGEVYFSLMKLVGRLYPSPSLINLIDKLSDLMMNVVPLAISSSKNCCVHLNSPFSRKLESE